jgi:hypothetical protein
MMHTPLTTLLLLTLDMMGAQALRKYHTPSSQGVVVLLQCYSTHQFLLFC